jgi:hypothetical protein
MHAARAAALIRMHPAVHCCSVQDYSNGNMPAGANCVSHTASIIQQVECASCDGQCLCLNANAATLYTAGADHAEVSPALPESTNTVVTPLPICFAVNPWFQDSLCISGFSGVARVTKGRWCFVPQHL